MDPYLIRALEMTPRLAEREVKSGMPGIYDARHDPGRFSFREVVAHLADWEPIMLERIRTGVETPGAEIKKYDEGQMAIDHNYAEADPTERLNAWRSDRRKTIEYVGALSEEDFAKKVMHPERGPMSVADLAHMLVSHDVYHLEQLMTMTQAHKTVDTW